MTSDEELRDLDRRVAGEVFGYTGVRVLSSGRLAVTDEDGGTATIPSFTTDPAAGVLVKEWLRGAGVEFIIHYFTKASTGEALVNVKQMMSPKASGQRPGRDSFRGVVRTGRLEGEAICRFALACNEAGLLQEGS